MSPEFLKQMLYLFLIRVTRVSKVYGTGKDYIYGQLNEACCQLAILEQKFSGSKKRGL